MTHNNNNNNNMTIGAVNLVNREAVHDRHTHSWGGKKIKQQTNMTEPYKTGMDKKTYGKIQN